MDCFRPQIGTSGRQRARGRGLSRRCIIEPLDLPDQALSLGIKEVFQGGTLRGEGELLVLITGHRPDTNDVQVCMIRAQTRPDAEE